MPTLDGLGGLGSGSRPSRRFWIGRIAGYPIDATASALVDDNQEIRFGRLAGDASQHLVAVILWPIRVVQNQCIGVIREPNRPVQQGLVVAPNMRGVTFLGEPLDQGPACFRRFLEEDQVTDDLTSGKPRRRIDRHKWGGPAFLPAPKIPLTCLCPGCISGVHVDDQYPITRPQEDECYSDLDPRQLFEQIVLYMR